MTDSDKQKTAQEVREHLVQALEADLIGPYDLHNPEAHEVLSIPPSRWYLTGFLAPEEERDPEDPTEEEQLGAGPDFEEEESSGEEPEAKQKKRFPASIGMSVLLPPGSIGKTLTAVVGYADYTPEKPEKGRKRVWLRHSREPRQLKIKLDEKQITQGVAVPGSGGLYLVGKLGQAQAPGLENGTLALSFFLVNRRPVPKKNQSKDEHFVFQVSLELQFEDGFVARSNRRGELSSDWDERVNDLHYRHHCEYAVGHGISTISSSNKNKVNSVKTTWLPKSEVLLVKTHSEKSVETSMESLAIIKSPQALQKAVGSLPNKYLEWIKDQEKIALHTKERIQTRDTLVDQARLAAKRIQAGIDLLANDQNAMTAFCLANQAMAVAARRRNPERYTQEQVPKWRLFQLAFVLLNISGLTDESHSDRKIVELIFFPTGGGKTEAYLGVIAFSLILRRLKGQARKDKGLGVSVLLRYTLRLLTLDQLGRAATLICALEQIRKEQPKVLGDVRFSVGLWVGRSATANTLSAVRKTTLDYKNGHTKNSPFPLPVCPWCGKPMTPDSLTIEGTNKAPQGVLVGCADFKCDFSLGKNKEGLPVLFVDEQIYRELPCFLVATVDKFAMLPWRGETGMLFGRVESREGKEFFGPLDKPKKSATPLPDGLLPPELIVQDELHLISGPLGTMVGLFETAIETLCSRPGASDEIIKPKIIASTATIRRAQSQIRSLFGRNRTSIFPPPGVEVSDNYFSKQDTTAPGRMYLGVGAAGRAMRAITLRTYISLMVAGQKMYEKNKDYSQAADAYMTLVGYFNSLRELGGMRRLVEDQVRDQCEKRFKRLPLNIEESYWYAARPSLREPVELTSRESTSKIAETRARLAKAHANTERVDALLASNMISVGIDIDRLGLMVVAGQPKTTSEYIQATSRVGRNPKWPGLVVTCFNLHKPRDRSHYETFSTYHESFYRFVEAMSITPFSGPALDRGLAGTFVAMTRLYDIAMTKPKSSMDINTHEESAQLAIQALKERSEEITSLNGQDTLLASTVAKRTQNLLDAWQRIVSQAKQGAGTLSYSRFDKDKGTKSMLYMALDEEKPNEGTDEAKFQAPTSMRDVEPVVHLWLPKKDKGSSHNG
jgi:hypothetical protein